MRARNESWRSGGRERASECMCCSGFPGLPCDALQSIVWASCKHTHTHKQEQQRRCSSQAGPGPSVAAFAPTVAEQRGSRHSSCPPPRTGGVSKEPDDNDAEAEAVSRRLSNTPRATDKLIQPGKYGTAENICCWMRQKLCVCINFRASMHVWKEPVRVRACVPARARACVCVLYVDGLCEGLQGKCSRLLSLRSCQSSAERNQKESKSQQ